MLVVARLHSIWSVRFAAEKTFHEIGDRLKVRRTDDSDEVLAVTGHRNVLIRNREIHIYIPSGAAPDYPTDKNDKNL